MDEQWYIQFTCFLEDTLERRIIQCLPIDIGKKGSAFEMQLFDRTSQFHGGSLWILQRQRSQAIETSRIFAGNFRKIIIDHFGQTHSPFTFFNVNTWSCQTQNLGLDTNSIQFRQSELDISMTRNDDVIISRVSKNKITF